MFQIAVDVPFYGANSTAIQCGVYLDIFYKYDNNFHKFEKESMHLEEDEKYWGSKPFVIVIPDISRFDMFNKIYNCK